MGIKDQPNPGYKRERDRMAYLRGTLRKGLHEGGISESSQLATMLEIVESLEFVLDTVEILEEFFSKPMLKLEPGSLEGIFGKSGGAGSKDTDGDSNKPSGRFDRTRVEGPYLSEEEPSEHLGSSTYL